MIYFTYLLICSGFDKFVVDRARLDGVDQVQHGHAVSNGWILEGKKVKRSASQSCYEVHKGGEQVQRNLKNKGHFGASHFFPG